MDDHIRKTYAKDSTATNKNALSDPYIKFFRWATDRLAGRDGIVCFVSNNSFVDQLTFDGIRKHLTQDFTSIYHLDPHGNVRKNPKLSGTTHNVFGIRVGMGITLLVRNRRAPMHHANDDRSRGEPSARPYTATMYYHRVPKDWRKEEKLVFLTQKQSIDGIAWQTLTPDAKQMWLTEGIQSDFASFMPMGTKEAKASERPDVEAIFKTYSRGVATSRDE